MTNKDEELEKMNRAKKELKKSEEESAATAVVGQSRGNIDVSKSLSKLSKSILVAFVLIAFAAGAWFLTSNLSKKESAVSVEQIREIAKLASAEAQVSVTIQREDSKVFGKNIPFNLSLPGTKREVVLIVPATVIAGVNLEELTSDDLKINEDEKKLEIVLPRATLLHEPAILMDQVETFSDEGLFRGEVKWDEGFNLAAEAQEDIKDKVVEIGLLEKAEESAEKFLKGFFENQGYTTVEVTFK